MALTDAKVRALCRAPSERDRTTVACTVRPSRLGSCGRCDARSPAKRTALVGRTPGVKISAPRQARDDAKARLRQGTDPGCVQ